MADEKLKELVTIAENNIMNIFSDEKAMKDYFDVLLLNPDITYYAAALVDGVDVYNTYEGWSEKGCQVKSGEHGTAVFYKRNQVKRKFIDDRGRVRDLSSASFKERQMIQNGDLKISSDLSSYYRVEYLFSQKQTFAIDENNKMAENDSEVFLRYEDVRNVVDEVAEALLEDNDYVLSNPVLKCTTILSSYLLCINSNSVENKEIIFKKSLQELLDFKENLSLSDEKLILSSVNKIIRSERILDLLKNIDNRESATETFSEDDKKKKIEDFGKKIGGARKDIWAERGLGVEDLIDMTLSEKFKYATKDNIFRKPDYDKMVADGVSVRAAYFIKTVRDALPCKPVMSYAESIDDKLSEEKIRGYVQFVSEFKEALLKVKTDLDILSFYENVVKDVYVTNKSPYSVVPTENSHGCLTNKLLKACQVNKYGLYSFDRKIQKKQFCYTEHDKKVDGFEIIPYNDNCFLNKDGDKIVIERKMGLGTRYYYPKGELADSSKWVKDTFFVTYKNNIICNDLNFEQAKEAVEKISDSLATKRDTDKKQRKSKFVPEQLEYIKRTGPDYGINEKNLADGDLYLDTFRFSGGEFGNWMTDKDRQASLNFGYDALMDLSFALNIEPCDISLGGQLSIAFGSRGHSSAAAHYEPERQVINLTKMRGAGSLAHEWGHALDNILSKKINNTSADTWLTDLKGNVISSVRELMNTIKYRTDTNGLYIKTDFYMNSIKFDSIYSKESKGYWQSDRELFARAFACYIYDKLPYKSDYLCGHANSAVTQISGSNVKAYPEGKERESINMCFDKVISQLKEVGLLHEKNIMVSHKKHGR